MKDNVAISVTNVTKEFRVPHERYSSLKQSILNTFSPKSYSKFSSVSEVSFEIKKGEFFGIVGRNGCGKSTLLKMIAGIYTTTKGDIKVNGTLSPFIELGVGFNPELTGRENIFLSGTILGMKRKVIEQRFDSIVEFSELGEFIDQKLKNYSSGMHVRLAFSIAVQAQSDIMLIDEVLAVGDAAFQAKCLDYFLQLKKEKRTIVFVSHDMGAVKRFCDRAVLINDSKMIEYGDVEKVIEKYSDINLKKAILEQNKVNQHATDIISNKIAKITNTEIIQNNRPIKKVDPNTDITVCFEVEAFEDIQEPILGVTIKQKSTERTVFESNTQVSNYKTRNLKKGDKLIFSINIKNVFSNGTYLVSPAIADKRSIAAIDRVENAAFFITEGWSNNFMPIQVKHTMKVKYGS